MCEDYIQIKSDNIVQISIIDIAGRDILNSKITKDKLNLSMIEKGVYFIQCKGKNLIKTFKYYQSE
jgi:hypothetical protein